MLEACCYTCCTVLVVVVDLLSSSKSIYSTLCGISFFFPPFFPSTSRRRRRRIGIGHGKEEGAKGEWREALEIPLHGTEEHTVCVAAVCPFSEPLCLRMRPGCQRRLPPTDDRRGTGGPETKYGKNPSCQILQRNGWREKEKKYPFAALFFRSLPSPFSPHLSNVLYYTLPLPDIRLPPTLFLFPFLRRSEAREIFMLP